MRRPRARLLAFGAGVLLLLGVLSIPLPVPSLEASDPAGTPFAWGQDSTWRDLEAAFRARVQAGCQGSQREGETPMGLVSQLLREIAGQPLPASAPVFDSLLHDYFQAAPEVAACGHETDRFLALGDSVRTVVKEQSRRWDPNARVVRDRTYRMLYGVRAAVEEVMLQRPRDFPALLVSTPESSVTPSVVVHGVRIHSGDILVSRGGYPTSALIARGNDYPGNFSHIALVHVDSSGHASTIEAHIERGVAIATPEEYLADKKLRIMVLRPRWDLPVLRRDPMLPHRAATAALERARREHIPYDFAMAYQDSTRLFCSEVASWAYRSQGVTLWMGHSTVSSPGLRRWLAAFGVRHFETQEPSDLEYDPQLAVVAEWRDPTTLWQDHVDNAVIDAMLEGAERGDRLDYPWYQLPVARLAKAWSWILGLGGGIGPVPEGMNAEAALRNTAFSARQRRLAAAVTRASDSLAQVEGYRPPYWRLVELAREAR